MLRSLYSGVSGLKNHQTKMDVIGNNISNVNTVGFKSGRVTFQDVYSQTLSTATAANADIGGTNPQQVGLGVSVGTIDTLFTRAASQRTDYPLDLSIEGDGFFVVGNGAGENYYTRAGNLNFDNNGNLVNGNGLFVKDINGNNINLGGVAYHDVAINTQGQLTGIPTGSSTAQLIATLGIATFTNNSGLSKAGENLYVETSNSGAPQAGSISVTDPVTGVVTTTPTTYKFAGIDGAGSINPGSLEMSNVDLSQEFTDMIVTQRGFQANARVITTSDQLLEELVNLKR